MTLTTVSRYHDFSAGHRVYGHESACSHIHGHNYRVTFTCTAPALDDVGRVVDFSIIKTLLCNWLEEHWDHRFLVYVDDPISNDLHRLDPAGTCIVPFNPTAENMASFLLERVGPKVFRGTSVCLVRVEVSETRKCSAVSQLERVFGYDGDRAGFEELSESNDED